MQLHEKLSNKINSDYWKKKLNEGMADSVIYPFTHSLLEKPEGKEQQNLTIHLPEAVVAEVARICNNSDVLVFTFHLTVLSALIFKYTKTGKLFFGSSYFSSLDYENRNAGDEHLVFYKTAIEKHLSFKELFSKLKEEVLDTAKYDAVSIDDIQEIIADGAIENLMQIGFMMEVVNEENLLLNNFELFFKLSNANNGGQLTADFDENKFDPLLITFFLNNYSRLLQNILANLYTPISDLDFLADDQKRLLLNDFSGPAKELTFPTVVERFEYQVTQTRDCIAVEFNDKKITYNELNTGANQLCRILLAAVSLEADDLVAVIMNRSEKMAEVILSVWKCGASYVPIDPEYPFDRIKTILENAAVKLIICESYVLNEGVKELLASFAPLVSLDEIEEEKHQQEKENLAIAVSPGSLAYVIYTSGSTGTPKGVMIEHIGMMNHLEAKLAEIEIGAESIVVQNAPQCFDISIWQFFAALMAGGKTIIYDNETVLNLEEFINRVDQDGVTTLELVPSYLLEMQYVLDEMKDEDLFSKLNILILNAETLMPAAVQRWLDAFPRIRIVNTYGATEVSDDMTHYIMRKLPTTATVPVMYRPIQNFKVYILDEDMQFCPIGVKGDIYLSGFAVGRGYFNDEEKTKAAFLSDPFAKDKKVRMYKTGDIGRLTSDGTMEFYGRQDYQVKIRGFRVELGEIEHQLVKIEGIKNAVVLDRGSEDNQRYLAAYILADNNVDTAAIAAKLREQLPDYMVPSFFIQLDAFPLTANGKINKKKLPDPNGPAQSNNSLSIAFVNNIEEKLTRIWQEVLGKKTIGNKDNFFEIGGHSLKATKLVYKIHRELEIKLDLRAVFVHPTIEEQAKIIANEKITRFKEIEPLPIQESYELSHAQKRLWILSQLENTSIAYNMHGAFLFEGALNKNALVNAFDELIKRHESLRTIFITINGEPRQKILTPGDSNFQLSIIDISGNPDRNDLAEKLANEEAITPFDLSKGPLIRVRLVGLDKNKYVFLFTMHHIISDGWSMGVLLNETLTFYNNFKKNKLTPLAPLRIQYKDYAAWQNAQLRDEGLEKNKKYWMSQLGEDELSVLELPYDKPRPRVQTFNGDKIDFLLDKGLVKKLNKLSKEKNVTFFVSLLAAVKILFYKYTGQTDIVIGSPIAGREHADLEDQIGFYVNTLALRTRLVPGYSFEQLLSIIKENSINAYEHQLYPFDRLVEDLELKKDLSRSAVFDVMVALQNTESGNRKPITMDGIKISGFPSKRMVSMFDLTISFSEEDGSYLTSMEYNTDLFNRNTIVRLGKHFSALLAELVAAPGKPISQISYTSEEENQLLHTNGPLVTYPPKKVIQLFEKQVERTPDNISIEYEGAMLTYRELNAKAEQLASFLAKNKKIKNQDIIAMQLERSPQAIISILAILKLNAVYLPIDINTPVERLAYVLQDSKTKLFITATEYEGLNVPCLDLQKINYEAFYTELKPLRGSILDSAYIIYTSGTTGNPKGVDISHASLGNYVNWFTRSYNITERDSTLLISSLGFDLGYTGFWSSLVSGTTMHIMKETKQTDPTVLMQHLVQHKISYIKLTPSHFKIIMDELRSTKAKLQLRLIVMGGEPIQVENVKEYFDYDKNVTIVNHYGPTETTIGAIATTINERNFKDFQILPHIGKPIDNTRVYILDTDGQFAPQGIIGEICIAGAGLAKGYFNNPVLTNEKFVTIHVGGNNERVYKTNDKGKQTEDGNIVLLGRKDSQVKIRGFRIELEEIENTLKKHGDIADAAVMAEDKKEKQLTAYVVPKPEASPFINGFKRYRLPNNLAVAQINKNETDYIYKEIFELQAYLRHGISLKEGYCIFDVGANIGLFSAFAHLACRNPKIYAFEPNPVAYNILSANASLYCPHITLFNCGLAEENKTSRFTFFEGFSLLSGLYADEKAERETIKTFMANQQDRGVESMQELVTNADQILNERFHASTFEVQLRSLSDIIEKEDIPQIDYLKINVEKAELDVLKGIRDEHWPRIRQIVLEVDVKANLPVIVSLLEKNGYDLIVEQDRLLEGTSLCYIYAIRKEDGNSLHKSETPQHLQLPYLPDKIISDIKLKDFIRKKLPDYMVPEKIVQIEKIPLTANGKVNKKALSHLSGADLDTRPEYIAPGNELEQKLCDIWQNVLGKEKIGINESFFEMGGNSMKVVELFRQINIYYPETINVTDLFDNTTIIRQAEFISSRNNSSKRQPEEAQVIEEIEL